MSPPPPTYIIVVFTLLMTSTLFFFCLNPLLSVVRKKKMQGNSKTANPTKAICHHPVLPIACHRHPIIVSCLPLPSPLAQHSRLSCLLPFLVSHRIYRHIRHRRFLLFTIAASCPPLLSSLIHRHCPLLWLIVTLYVNLLSLTLLSSLPMSSSPCCFIAVITTTQPHRWPRLSLPLPSCNASKFEARWGGLEIDKVSPSGRKNVGPGPYYTL
jgi:hypothetical protein